MAIDPTRNGPERIHTFEMERFTAQPPGTNDGGGSTGGGTSGPSAIVGETLDGIYPGGRPDIAGPVIFVGVSSPAGLMRLNDIWFDSDPVSIGVWVMTAGGLLQTSGVGTGGGGSGGGGGGGGGGSTVAIWTVAPADTEVTIILGDGTTVNPDNPAVLDVVPGFSGVTLDTSGTELDVLNTGEGVTGALWAFDADFQALTVIMGTNTQVETDNPAVLDVTPDINAQLDVGGTSMSIATL